MGHDQAQAHHHDDAQPSDAPAHQRASRFANDRITASMVGGGGRKGVIPGPSVAANPVCASRRTRADPSTCSAATPIVPTPVAGSIQVDPVHHYQCVHGHSPSGHRSRHFLTDCRWSPVGHPRRSDVNRRAPRFSCRHRSWRSRRPGCDHHPLGRPRRAGRRGRPCGRLLHDQEWSLGLNDGGNPIALSSPNVADLDGSPSRRRRGPHRPRVCASISAGALPSPGWPYNAGAPVDASPSVAPIDAGGPDTVYVGSGDASSPTTGGYQAIAPDGGDQWFVAETNPGTDPTPTRVSRPP